MKHNCVMRDKEGTVFQLFLDAVIDGTFEYDDFYDAYLWLRPRYERRKWWNPLRLVNQNKMTMSLDVLNYCPYCGEKLSEPVGELEREK